MTPKPPAIPLILVSVAVRVGLCLLLRVSPCPAAQATPESALRDIKCRIPRFGVIDLPAEPGTFTLTPEQGLTVEDIRGVVLDDTPPRLGQRSTNFIAKLQNADTNPAPYAARGIAPFRFEHFDCEYHYDGRGPYNWPMYEYASTHGFSRLGSYLLKPSDWTHLSEGTEWVKVSGYHWGGWFKKQGIEPNRWDRLAEAVGKGAAPIPEGHYKTDGQYAMIMIDEEFGGLLPLSELRQQPWYPSQTTVAEQRAFEDRYTLGYTLAYALPGEAAHRDGWARTGIYAWQTFRKSWYGLDPRISLDLSVPWARRFIDRIYDAYDILYIDGYCAEWSPGNVAYTLGAADEALAYARARGGAGNKPVRLYLSTVILNRPAVGPWLRIQPLPTEDLRAMFALQLFTGVDGLVQWNWAGRLNQHQPPSLKPPKSTRAAWENHVVQVGTPFRAQGADGTHAREFTRYDFLRIVHAPTNHEDAAFAPVDPTVPMTNQIDDAPLYRMPGDKLSARLRPTSEAVAAMVEGLALVKPFEAILAEGQPVIDVPARKQYEENLPIVRRVVCGHLHLIATYDPLTIHGHPPRSVTLHNIGHKHTTLNLPADQQIRIFVIRAANP